MRVLLLRDLSVLEERAESQLLRLCYLGKDSEGLSVRSVSVFHRITTDRTCLNDSSQKTFCESFFVLK